MVEIMQNPATNILELFDFKKLVQKLLSLLKQTVM
jgi:hypothetical protein